MEVSMTKIQEIFWIRNISFRRSTWLTCCCSVCARRHLFRIWWFAIYLTQMQVHYPQELTKITILGQTIHIRSVLPTVFLSSLQVWTRCWARKWESQISKCKTILSQILRLCISAIKTLEGSAKHRVLLNQIASQRSLNAGTSVTSTLA